MGEPVSLKFASKLAVRSFSKRMRSLDAIKGGTDSESFSSLKRRLNEELPSVSVPGSADSGPAWVLSGSPVIEACICWVKLSSLKSGKGKSKSKPPSPFSPAQK